jgi:hypothetical protein
MIGPRTLDERNGSRENGAVAVQNTLQHLVRWELQSAKAASPRRHKDQQPAIGQSGSRSVLRVFKK